MITMIAPTLLTGLSPWTLAQLYLAATLLSAQWLRVVVCTAPPGVRRLLRALPVLVLCQVAAFLFNHDDQFLLRLVAMFIISWLAFFKVLALCLGRGPIQPQHSLAQVTTILLLPIYPQGPATANGTPQGRLADASAVPAMLLAKSLLNIAVLACVLALAKVDLPVVVRQFILAFGLYNFVCLLMNGPASIVTRLVGLSVIPPFDKPFLSHSFADFWGRRWNITTSSVLRVLIYDVVAEGSLVKLSDAAAAARGRPAAWRRALGVVLTFLVSGVAHELILWMIQPDGFVSGKWLVFFTMQGPIMLAEAALVRWWRLRRLPPLNIWPARIVTLALLEACAFWFFFPPVEQDSQTSRRVMQALETSGAEVMGVASEAVVALQAWLGRG